MTQKLAETKVGQRSGIEAFQLQILCEYLEDKIIKGEIPGNRIEPQHFADKINEVFEGYYQRLINKLDPAVQQAAQLLIEEKLIFEDEKTGEARRLSVDSGVLLHEAGITQILLHQLESTFLLRRESTSTGGFNYEVSHDTMIAPILKSKTERKTRERAAQERLTAQRRQRRLLAILIATILALAAVTGAVVCVVKLRNDAVAALQVAEQEKANAVKSLHDFLEAQKARKMVEFQITLQNVKGILKGGNCPPAASIQQIKGMQVKYLKDRELQVQIKDILDQMGTCN